MLIVLKHLVYLLYWKFTYKHVNVCTNSSISFPCSTLVVVSLLSPTWWIQMACAWSTKARTPLIHRESLLRRNWRVWSKTFIWMSGKVLLFLGLLKVIALFLFCCRKNFKEMFFKSLRQIRESKKEKELKKVSLNANLESGLIMRHSVCRSCKSSVAWLTQIPSCSLLTSSSDWCSPTETYRWQLN